MEKIYGVNLGNWLVLEKWMDPGLFEGTDAEDETDLCNMLPRQTLLNRLQKHRDSYITRKDFEWIKERGINTLRIPVPHFIFGDDPVFCSPYVGCIEYLDRAFDWAEGVGLKILIDLHTAPDSQNGFDNGGICGVCKFAQKSENVERVIKVLGMLAQRYAASPALWGIEILNEPVSGDLWPYIQARYPARDPERAQGSTYVSLNFLYDFYTRAYQELRHWLKEDKVIMFHDGFRLTAWKEFMQTEAFQNVWLDTHIYVGMLPVAGERTDAMIVAEILDQHRSQIKEMARYFPVVVGEWCLSHNRSDLERLSPWQKQLSYRLIADAQLSAWDSVAGFFFWSYKLISEPEGWDFRRAVNKGWLPDHFGAQAADNH
ncbi:cellulase family glycosylhydrolase [Oscillospiraceae bacterium HV4-5-C5C]|nr:cellulase family glycosylhydrolase [Oscillospiraceae bacterium HV4-5-C5C]